MNSEFSNSAPYRILGLQLKRIRENCKESVAEVSGAIEIDEINLNLIEQGKVRPGEDVLLLLITHFSMADEEALRIWGLAGYDDRDIDTKSDDGFLPKQQILMVMTQDPRVMYSDNIQVVANPNGVIINFLQSPGGPYQAQTVSRIGMSREQAKKVIDIMGEALKESNKYLAQLPKSSTQNQNPAKNND